MCNVPLFCIPTACVIDTYDSDFSAKVIMMTWQANIARRSAGLGTLLSSEDHDMAAAYYRETIVCLQKATKFRELVDVLEDFSAEVLTDLELKDCAFKSRELIITCFQMLDNFLYKPAVLKGERGRQTEILPIHGNKNRLAAEAQRAAQAVSIGPDRASQQISRVSSKVSVSVAESLGSPFARGIELDPDSRESMSIEQEHKLKIVAVDRMKLIFCILKVRTMHAHVIYHGYRTSPLCFSLHATIPWHPVVFVADVQLRLSVEQVRFAARSQVGSVALLLIL